MVNCGQPPLLRQKEMKMSKVIELLNVVSVDVRFPSVGRTSTKKVDGDVNVYQSTSARYCDPATFAGFAAIRRRVDRACLATGTRFIGGVAVPDGNIDQLLGFIKTQEKVFADAKSGILATWPQPVIDWADKYPSESQEILRLGPSYAQIEAGLAFDVAVFKVTSQNQPLQAAGLTDGIESATEGFGASVAREIAADVRDTWRNRGEKGGGEASGKIRESLRRWRTKADSLRFLDRRVESIVDMIDSALAKMPASGKIEGHDFMVLSGLIAILSDPDNITQKNAVCVDIGETPPAEEIVLPVKQRVTNVIDW